MSPTDLLEAPVEHKAPDAASGDSRRRETHRSCRRCQPADAAPEVVFLCGHRVVPRKSWRFGLFRLVACKRCKELSGPHALLHAKGLL